VLELSTDPMWTVTASARLGVRAPAALRDEDQYGDAAKH
jgi:hypothetical protein